MLDLGSGTGNHALPLAQRGYEVVGVERSESMLAQARAKAAQCLSDKRLLFRCWRTFHAFGRQIMVRKLITIIALASGVAVAACNTVEGVGKDVESVGDTVQDAAH